MSVSKPKTAAPEDSSGTGPTDAEAKLLKELMTLKNKLKAVETEQSRYAGIDPEQARSVLAAQDAIQAQAQAIEAQRLQDAGDFDGLKKQLAAAHAAEKRAIEDTLAARESQIAQLAGLIHERTIGQAFATSQFFRQETLLPPSKARRIYEAYCDLGEDGRVHVFDAPAGTPERALLVDSSGEPLPFDEAMKRIVEADPDKDQLLRAHRTTTPQKSATSEIIGTGMTRIASILRQGKETLDTTPPPPDPATARPGTDRIDAILKAQAHHRAPKPVF